MKMNCRLQIPYPPVTVEAKNKRYADILMPLYTGSESELTALSNYSYQALITENNNKRLSDILECISLTEMTHFRILGKLIHKLGADPVLYIPIQKNRRQYWNSAFCDFTYEPQIFLNSNIISEKRGIEAYTYAYNNINDPFIRDILKRIIADEEHHIKIFNSLLK